RDTLSQVMEAGHVDTSELNADIKVDPELAAIVKKCTDPDRAHRYESASELTEDIRKYLEDRQISVSPDMHHRRVVKWTRRNPMLAGVLYGLLAAAAIHILWAIWAREFL
ncbi:MAG: hypothetical protein JXR97_08920, partial [Planctomycetes bacterium]|nr:hypothetical protein [Planctomycetota bacterium]